MSLDATIGRWTTGRPRRRKPRAVSSTLPPQAPTMTRARLAGRFLDSLDLLAAALPAKRLHGVVDPGCRELVPPSHGKPCWHALPGKYHGPGQAVRSGGQPANPVRDHLISSVSQPCNQIFDVMLRYDHPRRIIARRRPNCHYKPSNDGKLQIRQVHLDISADHVQMSCSHAFDVLGQIHGLCKQGVAGHRCVLNRNFSTVSSGASLPGFPYLQPTRKECDLHAAIARIVAMRQGIDNGLNYDFLWNLISYRCLNALRPRAHRQRDFAQHKIQCLIDQVVCITLWPRSSSIWTV